MIENVLDHERKKQRYGTAAVLILTGLLIILFSSGTSLNVGSLFNGSLSLLIATENIQLVSFIFSIIIVIFGWAKIKINNFGDIFWIFLPLILMTIALVSQGIGTQKSNTIEIMQSTIHVFIIYYLICFTKLVNFSFNREIVSNFIVAIGFFEAVLGILQHLTRNTFFNPQQLNAIYFLNGASSSNINYLGLGASVRAFGTFDSGLTLGVFLIFSLAIMIDISNIKKFFKVVLTMVYVIAIYFTLTRNIYIGFVVFTLLFFLIKSNIKVSHVKFIYILITIISASLFWLTNLLNWIASVASSVNIETFGARFIFLKQIINEIPNTLHFLLGSNITSSNGIPIDSSAITIIAQFGLIFAIFVFLLQTDILVSTISDAYLKKPALGAFLFLFPIIGASNNVVQSFLVASAIISLFNNKNISLL